MGNIVLSRTIMFIYIVLCLVFLVSPFISGKDKRFGFKVKKSKNVYVVCFMYSITSVCAGTIFAFLSLQRKSIVFVNVLFILYILLMAVIYLYIRDNFKIRYTNDIFREIILNNPPEMYVVGGISIFFYALYLIPLAISYFSGKNNKYVFYICGFQIIIAIVSFAFNILIRKTRHYIDEDVEKSVKRNIKYRKLLNFIVFCTLLILSAAISVLYILFVINV